LILYDPENSDDVFLEQQILSHTISNGTHTEEGHIKVLDPVVGVVVVYHGKYWSLVNMAATLAYLAERNEAKSPTAATAAPSPEEKAPSLPGDTVLMVTDEDGNPGN